MGGRFALLRLAAVAVLAVTPVMAAEAQSPTARPSDTFNVDFMPTSQLRIHPDDGFKKPVNPSSGVSTWARRC